MSLFGQICLLGWKVINFFREIICFFPVGGSIILQLEKLLTSVEGSPTVSRTMTIVTSPAWGIPAAPTEAAVAVMLMAIRLPMDKSIPRIWNKSCKAAVPNLGNAYWRGAQKSWRLFMKMPWDDLKHLIKGYVSYLFPI